MSKSHTNKLALFLTVFLLLCCTAYALPADHVATAKASVAQFYPELTGKDLHIAITDGGLLDVAGPLTDFTMSIQRAVHTAGADEGCPQSLLYIRFAFPANSSDQRVFSLSANGPAVNASRLEQLAHQIDSHPGWSDSEATKALLDAGARFGPTSEKELLEKLPVEGLRLLVGDYEVRSTHFTVRDAAQMREHLPSAMLFWTVTVTSHLKGRELTYYLNFEPFEGKLVSIGRIPPVP
jgi:hypothetical protein